jgi:cyclic pyranopterin monophosphate synthase
MLSHVDERSRPTMVDVSGKAVTRRTAVAAARVRFPHAVAEQLRAGGFATSKGPVFQTAIVAGVMAAKRTHELIPFCHPLGIEDCRVEIDMEGDEAVIRCSVAVNHRTGVEMEALTGASVAALTVYDMCKALSHAIVITETRLLEKHGGKRDVSSLAPLYGLVLAGGSSTRMRRDKAALEIHGASQLAWSYALLERHCERVFVSVRAEQRAERVRAGFPQIVDGEHGAGPIAGIIAAQTAHPRAAWLVLACDLPFVDDAVFARLVAARETGRPIVAYRSTNDGLPEPLCAIYEPESVAAVREAIAAGRHCPRKLVIASGVPLLEQTSPALGNLNTPEELAAAERQLAATRS